MKQSLASLTTLVGLLWLPGVCAAKDQLMAAFADPMAGMSLDGMEASLIAMAEEGATPGLLPFIYQIYNLTGSMKLQVEIQSKNSQQSLDSAWQAFTSCKFSQSTSYNLDALKSQYQLCKQQQSQCVQDQSLCSTDCTTECLLVNGPCSTFNSADVWPAKGTCAINTDIYSGSKAWITTLKNYFAARYSNWTQSKVLCDAQTAKCNNCWNQCKSKVSQCNSIKTTCSQQQTALENAGCQSIYSGNCEAYTSCYNTQQEIWQNTNKTVAGQESAFTAEYRGILRVECLLNAFVRDINGTAALQSEIELCINNDYTSPQYIGQLLINYYNINLNPLQACSATPNAAATIVPGSVAWIQQYYTPLPANTFYDPCNSACCQPCRQSTYGCCTDGVLPKMSLTDSC